ncbi:glutamyl-tRNA reductase [Virgibacillus halodenitrificans]|uniref:glutamyl-tRNA reductase n=1 Tax=Virgibacillus halodenitrificans TaxID=1482 RepID=UPI00045CDA08|nr:glutamyl-tRNA reductase [Virgibacillus halodenitrificans]MCG1027888.1 glutamyl-tRNA reductase [Virgibacillus halodenitrificans]MCJ0930711.1 glutamyl-tRNA reductase [Virgibacillus halodenitrificans]MYL44888.1 glutamyl-tRNA reductase [Virgibacillus halodenitrificans]MYL56009.1 glutamyl-tRNA reductase [Virgibacillus halodenitrificans]CDQ36896.1 Glutamyl-tRNA reductase [Virgibacillus halodenitrificans]
MHIIKVGFNYKSAPVEVREKLTFAEHTLPDALNNLKQQKSILENVIVSTCNRTEIYAVVDQLHTGRYYIKQFLADWFQLEKEAFTSYLRIAENDGALEHLFRVTSGLDSMIIGETQILGQVRQAFFTAQDTKTTGTIFNQLFKQAITFGKRMQKETTIGENAVSVSYAAVELAKKIFGDLSNKHVVILGAGKMGELAAKNLQGSGATEITVVNRTLEKAEALADKFAAKADQFDNLLPVLQKADILISSTGSEELVLTKQSLAAIQKKRKGNPLFLVDIAVPRDLDPRIGELENVFLYDIDDLQHIVDENLQARKAAAEQIEIQVEEEIVLFKEWLKTLGVVPVISALRQKALSIQAETMKSIERKIPDLTVREKKVLNKHTKSIINQLLKEPVTQAKELADSKDADESLALFVNIFGIEEEVKEELAKQVVKKKNNNEKNNEKEVSFPNISPLTTF